LFGIPPLKAQNDYMFRKFWGAWLTRPSPGYVYAYLTLYDETKSQFGCGYLQAEQEVTESLILQSNHNRTSFAA